MGVLSLVSIMITQAMGVFFLIAYTVIHLKAEKQRNKALFFVYTKLIREQH